MSNAVQVNYAKGEEPELQPEAKLFVANIPKTANEEAIRVVFQPYGDIEEVFIMKEKGTGDSKGCGFVKFEDYSCADAAVKVPSPIHTHILTHTHTYTYTYIHNSMYSHAAAQAHTHTHTQASLRGLSSPQAAFSGFVREDTACFISVSAHTD
jgi:RNA recognition motif-containing protein